MSERILIIRPGAIGDALLTFPILQALKEQRQAHITFVSNPTVIPLVQEYQLADVVYDYGSLAWSELFSLSGIHSPFIRNILQQTDSVICWLRDPDGILECNLRNAGTTPVLIAPSRPDEASNVHIVTYLAGTIGMGQLGRDRCITSLSPIEMLAGRDTSVPTRASAHTIAIHPGSGGAAKCWPIEHFASVITNLWQQHIPVLLLAGPADTERLAMLLKLIATPHTSSLLEIMTNAPLLEVATCLKQCRAYLGNDSGITHLAAMLGLPTIALFGPSNPNVWRPVGPHVQVLYNPRLEEIQVKFVVETLVSPPFRRD